jgi:NAD(P)-dependent dehydrogenase (short-subunit alcohol dehydrogenase family)
MQYFSACDTVLHYTSLVLLTRHQSLVALIALLEEYNHMTTNSSTPPIDLQGQVALITGGGRGLGRAFAQALSARGAAVAVIARSQAQVQETADLIVAAGGQVLALPGDVTNAARVTDIVKTVEQRFGPIDILINNAGVITPIGPLWEVDPTAWWHTLDIHVRGSFLYAHAVLPSMIARRRGRIINITSAAGWGGVPYGSAYSLSKAALSCLTGCLAGETQQYGITVFSYAPGFVRSAMTEYLAESPEVERWYGDTFSSIFASGTDTPITQTIQGLLWLVSGAADGLSGRNIGDWDDIADLVQRAKEIQPTDHYTLGRITEG